MVNLALNDEDVNNVFMNKDSPPDNEFVTPFGRMQPENEQVFQEDPRASTQDLSVNYQFI
jgi:hypothetical protein